MDSFKISWLDFVTYASLAFAAMREVSNGISMGVTQVAYSVSVTSAYV
jgi:hypothetical protein